MVLAGERAIDATAATQITRRPLPAQYEPPKRGRPLWPWLLGAGGAARLLVGDFFLYDSIQRQLKGSETVAVPYVVGHPRRSRRRTSRTRASSRRCIASRTPRSRRAPSSHRARRRHKVDKETVVRIDVSSNTYGYQGRPEHRGLPGRVRRPFRSMGSTFGGGFWALLTVVYLAYGWATTRQTPGKHLLGLRVLTESAGDVSAMRGIMRAILCVSSSPDCSGRWSATRAPRCRTCCSTPPSCTTGSSRRPPRPARPVSRAPRRPRPASGSPPAVAAHGGCASRCATAGRRRGRRRGGSGVRTARNR